MKIIKRSLLGMLTTFFPVVLAACYGPPTERFQEKIIEPPETAKACSVVDSETKMGIGGMKAICRIGQYDVWATYTDESGSFRIIYDEPCEFLLLEDVDNKNNGGLFEAKTVEFPGESEDCNYELNQITR